MFSLNEIDVYNKIRKNLNYLQVLLNLRSLRLTEWQLVTQNTG